MALTAPQKGRLREVLFEFALGDWELVVKELFLGYFESAAARTARAQGWVTVVRARRQAQLTGADAENTTKKSLLTTDIADLDAITSAV